MRLVSSVCCGYFFIVIACVFAVQSAVHIVGLFRDITVPEIGLYLSVEYGFAIIETINGQKISSFAYFSRIIEIFEFF